MSRSDYYRHLAEFLLGNHSDVEICSEQRVYNACLQHQAQSDHDEFVVIIDIVRCQHEAIPFLKGICSGELTHKTRIILISSLLTWCGHPSQSVAYSLENNGLRFRTPIHAYTETLQLENSFYALSSEMTEVIVIGRGLIYGRGGFDFHPIIRSLLKDEHVMPLMNPGEGPIPAIHIDDFCGIVNVAISSASIPLYIPAIDSCPDSLHSIISHIASELDVPQFTYSEMDNALEFAVENPEVVNLFQCRMKFSEHSFNEIPWKFQLGLFECNVPSIMSEYKAANNLSPCRLMVVGMPSVGKTALAKILSNKYCKAYLFSSLSISFM